MRYIIFLSALLCFARGWNQDTMSFRTPKEMADYAFSGTDFSQLPSPFLINRSMEIDPSKYTSFLEGDKEPVRGVNTIGLFSLLQWWDTRGVFSRDEILFPVFDHISMMDQDRDMHIPLFVTDMDVIELNSEVWDNFKGSNSTDPFPSISSSDVHTNHLLTASLLFDTVTYNKVFVKFDESTFISNTGRTVLEIRLRSEGTEKIILPGQLVSLKDWLSERDIEIEVRFTDGTSFTKIQHIHWQNIRQEKDWHETLPKFWEWVQREYYDPSTEASIDNPEGKFSIYPACDDKKIRKPFFMIAGWGTHTDLPMINHNQSWPSPMFKTVRQFNQDGLVEDLHAQGFDLIFVQFFPPNASIVKNSVVLEKIINRINNEKYENGSYEESTLMGISAGALAAKLTLQVMEKKHLEQNGPHPHTRLLVSYDGENGAANVPLGMQHAVKYLWDYEYNSFVTDYNIYALNYILNAPLSRELLYYFHTATGYGETPGQGCDPMRTNYLQYMSWYNHDLNQHIPGYPSFQRNISLSNGSSVPNYDFAAGNCVHEPYPHDMGAIFFKQSGSLMGWVNRRFAATFLKYGIHRVFYYEYKPLFKSWRVGYEAKTKNPLLLDNAPGGMIFISQNPIRNINQQLGTELTGAPSISENYLFSFTPTMLTHDVRNLNGNVVNGCLNYNFKANLLMFDNEADAATGNPQYASDYFGYPHLGYPGSHYDYTPFDAVFGWSQNTEHLTGNRKSANWYDGEYCDVRLDIKNFIVSESEGWNIMLQNKRIGYFARPGFTYRVDYEAQNGIYLGNHITQKTDFYDMTSEPNAVVEAQAATEIVFTAGVHLKAGTTFHAFIGDPACEKSISVGSNDPDGETEQSATVLYKHTENHEPVIYPNPNKAGFTVDWAGISKGTALQLTVSDLTGKQILMIKGVVGSEIKHELSKGLYIVTIQNGEACYSKRIIVE